MPPKKKTPERTASRGKTVPPGRIKIANALRTLLEEKGFHAITTAEIAATAGVTEALIYKYFSDKRDLLYHVLSEYLEQGIIRMRSDMKGVTGSLQRLRSLMRASIDLYASNRVFAQILLLEVRNFPDYFESNAYQIVKGYAKMLRSTIQEGIDSGEIQEGLQASSIGQFILGGIEHLCLPEIVFNRPISPAEIAEDLYSIVIKGIAADTRD